MSDEQRLRTANPRGEALVAGAASGILYSSAVFAFAFLIPVQLIYGRQGKKNGLATAGIAFAFALMGQMGRDLLATPRTDWTGLFGLSPLLALILPPFFLLALLALMKIPTWTGSRSSWGRLMPVFPISP